MSYEHRHDVRRVPTYWTIVTSDTTSDIPLFELRPCHVEVGHFSRADDEPIYPAEAT
jgi:hypothetical protein